MRTDCADVGLVDRRGLAGTGPWTGLSNGYVRGADRLSDDARAVLARAMTYRNGQVPSRKQFYEEQKTEAVALGQKYLSDKRIKHALRELKDRGFYAVRKVSDGPGRWVNLRSFSNLPFDHVKALENIPREQILERYLGRAS